MWQTNKQKWKGSICRVKVKGNKSYFWGVWLTRKYWKYVYNMANKMQLLRIILHFDIKTIQINSNTGFSSVFCTWWGPALGRHFGPSHHHSLIFCPSARPATSLAASSDTAPRTAGTGPMELGRRACWCLPKSRTNFQSYVVMQCWYWI